jgi:putative nucleotidyltransferase with HDIG domain
VRDGVRQYHLIKENRRQQEIIKQQKEELSSWNQNLKGRVLAQTTQIRRQVEDVHRLNQRLQSNFQGVIESMVALAELRDPKTRRHSANTASLSIAMAQALNLPSNEIEIIRIAALLHDIGKNAMSDVALAMDENNYTDEDYLEYRKHPVLGQIALDSIEDLRPAALLIRHHHERYDGMGFPDGLSGDAIPMGASIIALADCCDREMAFHFARNAVESAIDNLLKRSGTVFPPSLLPYLAKPAHDLFDHLYERHDGLTEMKVVPEKLKPGMILTSELFSRSGLLLLQAWTELDSAKIKSLQRIFTIDPLPGGIPVAIRHSRKSSSI